MLAPSLISRPSRWNAVREMTLIVPPSASPSRSGVLALMTSMLAMPSATRLLVLKPRVPIRFPSRVKELKSPPSPRMLTLEGVPSSSSLTLIPGRRCKAYPMLPLCMAPNVSSETMLTMPRAVFCWLIASACPRAASATSNACIFNTSLFIGALTVCEPSALTMILSLKRSKPMYSTSIAAVPVGTFANE